MRLIYKYWCTHCGKIGYAKRSTDFSDTNCNNCNSRAFGLIKYELVKDEAISKSYVLCECGHTFIMHVSIETFAEVNCNVCECKQFKQARK